MSAFAFGFAWVQWVSRFGFLFLLPVLVGCGSGVAKVTGRVLYDGKPVPGGLVMFQSADTQKRPVTAVLDEGGNYEAVLPIGEVSVGVDNRELEPRSSGVEPAALGLPVDWAKLGAPDPGKAPPKTPPKSPQNSGRYVKIPDKYYVIATSELKFTVTGGGQTHDIELPKVVISLGGKLMPSPKP